MINPILFNLGEIMSKKKVAKKIAKKKASKKVAKKIEAKKVAKKKATKKVAKKKVAKKVAKKKATKKVAKKKATKKVAKKKVAKKVAKKKATKKVAKKKITKKVAKKKVTKKVAKKKITKKVAKKKATKKVAKKINTEKVLLDTIIELIKRTSTELPADVQKVVLGALEREQENTSAHYAMQIIEQNIGIAKSKVQPLCQDTGTISFFIDHPVGFDQHKFTSVCENAVVTATELGLLRQNSVDPITGENVTMNIGPGHPSIHYHQTDSKKVSIRLMLKGGGCENVGAQYKLPNTALNAGRDLDGVRKVILDAVVQAQGKGCGPGILGVCVGGDRSAGYMNSKEQLLRKLDDTNSNSQLAELEANIVESANKLGIGPMGFGGNTTLLGTKIGILNRLPASYFVSISYMCWAYRRQGVELKNDNSIQGWLY
jgi:fumarate hydratase, class I